MSTHGVHLTTRKAIVIAFMEWFGLQENQAQTLAVLFELKGRTIDAKDLAYRVSSHRNIGVAAIWERIRVIRSAMNAESLDTSSRGYALTDLGMSECKQALASMAKHLALQGRRAECVLKTIDADDIESLPLMKAAVGAT